MSWKLSAFADEIGPDPELQFSTLRRLGVGEIQLRGAWGKGVMELSTSELQDLESSEPGRVQLRADVGGRLVLRADVRFAVHDPSDDVPIPPPPHAWERRPEHIEMDELPGRSGSISLVADVINKCRESPLSVIGLETQAQVYHIE